VLMGSLGDSIRTLIEAIQQNTLQVPPPPETVAAWPVVGEKLHTVWSRAHDDLPALVQSLQPKVGDLALTALGFVASIGGGLLAFLGALVLAGIFMAYGEQGARACLSIFTRLAGEQRGPRLARLSTATIRTVAQGVVGVALIQAILIGLALLVAGVPWAGALAAVVLVLGIVQIPAVIVTLPAIVWIWWRGSDGTGEALLYTALLLVSGMADNVLKPLLLGRGVDVPMPVILVGALGGMAWNGIIGMFAGATLLALAWQICTGWVDENPDADIHPYLGILVSVDFQRPRNDRNRQPLNSRKMASELTKHASPRRTPSGSGVLYRSGRSSRSIRAARPPYPAVHARCPCGNRCRSADRSADIAGEFLPRAVSAL